MGRTIEQDHNKTVIGRGQCHVGEADVTVTHLDETHRHNHYQNLESRKTVTDKDYGLSPQRVKVYHNRESKTEETAGVVPAPKWKSKINETTFSLAHEPESAASTMEMRSVKPDLVNRPTKGPIRANGKGNTDAGLKFGGTVP
eukprot:Rhum_TRINITY_DN7694_c2_g1::Rhum_TRINITY_DN7694_c2_g1_i1::g.24252::m.24252